MHISRFTFGIAALALMTVLSAPSAQCASPTVTLAEQEVIEALLPQCATTRISKKHVIKDTTSVQSLQISKDYDAFSKELRQQAERYDQAFRNALDNFLKKNRTAVQIVFPTNPPESVELVSTPTVNDIFSTKPDAKANGWEIFYRRFPDSGGLITISRVGIDSKGTVAIIYLGQQSDYLSGFGRIYVLRREAGKWVLSHEAIGAVWVS